MDNYCCANCKHFNYENGFCDIQQDWIAEDKKYFTYCSFWKQTFNIED